MFERFTERARKVMALANQEAQRFNHEYIGTEHMLLGLVKEGSGVGANVLKNLGVDLAKVRAEVEKLVKPRAAKVTMDRLPTTPRAKKVTEHAINEARKLNHNYIGSEHLLLGMLCESEGVAAQVLTSLGVKLDEARDEVSRLLGTGRESQESPKRTRYDRFTERGRKVMALANQEAQRFHHEYVDTEHILLGLVEEGSGVGANVLKNMGLDPAKVRAEVEKLVKSGPSDMVTMGRLPTAPRAKKVTDHATAEARKLNHNYVGTEHLLMGLACVPDGVAAQVLTNLGLKLDEVREEVLRMLGASIVAATPPADGAVAFDEVQKEVVRLLRQEAGAKAPAVNRPARLVFTQRAGTVMVLANREAQILDHNYIGTEHLLLGLVKEGGGVGANALKNLGVTVAAVLADVEKLVKPGADKVAKGEPAITHYEKVLDYAGEEALELKRRYLTYIGTGHLLVGLLREREGIAGQVLANLGLKLDEVREEILRMVGEKGEPEGADAESATHLNVEIKARYALPGRVQEVLQDPDAEFRGVDNQVDTYFNCPNGRLKLREGNIETALIHYQRPDLPGPKESVVCLHRPADPAALKESLTRAYGVMVTVKKRREIYRIDNVKFHVDQVEGLGSFIEIEAIDADGTIGIEKLRGQCEKYIQLLGIPEADLVRESYSDMLLSRSTGL